jgi:thymidylate synthase (FAD)
MLLVKPSFEILMNSAHPLMIEYIGRVCYKSEEKITDESHKKFIKSLLDRGHESVIEHSLVTVKIICDRGVTHEIVRHRLASYSQESTRYCDYSGGVTFVIPPWTSFLPGVHECLPGGEYFNKLSFPERSWFISMILAEKTYKDIINSGWTPQQARAVLPNSLKTEIVVSCNLREWRHIFRLRTSPAAHPQMREIMIPILRAFTEQIPIFFDDLYKGLNNEKEISKNASS